MDNPGSLPKEDLALLRLLIARYGPVNLITMTRALASSQFVPASECAMRRTLLLPPLALLFSLTGCQDDAVAPRAGAHSMTAATSPSCSRMDGVLSRASMISNASTATGSQIFVVLLVFGF